MSQPSTATEPKISMDSNGSALEHWKHRLMELPAVRLEKVRSVRGAISRSSYESEQVLECTLQQLSNDLGVLCREESSTPSA